MNIELFGKTYVYLVVLSFSTVIAILTNCMNYKFLFIDCIWTFPPFLCFSLILPYSCYITRPARYFRSSSVAGTPHKCISVAFLRIFLTFWRRPSLRRPTGRIPPALAHANLGRVLDSDNNLYG